MAYVWLWVNIAALTAAPLFVKEATLIVGEAPENTSELTGWLLKFLSNSYNLSAVFFFVLGGISYVIAVSRLKLSYIYPLSQAAQLVFILLFSLLLFEEKVTWLGWLAIVTICMGIFLVSMPRNISESKL